MAKDKPVMMFEKRQGKLVPLTPIDAELMDDFPEGALFCANERTRRSNPQNSLYWVVLSRVVKATGKWPTPYKLHHALLIDAEFFTPVANLDGTALRLEPDSSRFSAMGPKEFSAYFEAAMARLASVLGYDPLAFYEEERLRQAG